MSRMWIGFVGAGLVSILPALTTPTRADEQPPMATPASPLVIEGTINAPVAEVWKVFSTAEGFKKFGVAKCDLDLRIGGLIRSRYDPNGVLGDDETIVSEILAYEPERMIAFRVKQPPADFPFSRATWSNTWSVATLTDLGNGRTHLRLAGLGYTRDEESQKMRRFFEAGNTWTLQVLQRQFDETAPGPQRSAHGEDPLAPVTHQQTVNLPRLEVWELFTTSAGWKQFFDVDARIELRPAGAFELLFDKSAPAGKQGSEGCSVLSFVPEEMVSFTWNAPPKFTQARSERTWVVVRFDALSPTRTRVRLDHLGFARQVAERPEQREEWKQVRAYFRQAWGHVLERLAKQGTPATQDEVLPENELPNPKP